jgi:hypothetical protein
MGHFDAQEQFRGRKGIGPLEKSQEIPHYVGRVRRELVGLTLAQKVS